MRLIILVCLFLPGNFSKANTFYVSPGGDNANPGSISAPFASIDQLSAVMKAGDTAYLRGGIYFTARPNNISAFRLFELKRLNGTAANLITIQNYPGETVVFDLHSFGIPVQPNTTALYIDGCNYIHLKGIRVTGLQQNHHSGTPQAWKVDNSSNNIFEQIEMDHIQGNGLLLGDGSNNNLFKNCDAHHIEDPYSSPGAYGGANGFSATGRSTATNNTFDGCRAWLISDDGFDLYQSSGFFTIINCWSFWNGYHAVYGNHIGGDGNGFKLGPDAAYPAAPPRATHHKILRVVMNCLAFQNYTNGFDQNNGDMRCILYNNSTYNNRGYGYMWGFIAAAAAQDFKNNLAFLDSLGDRRGKETNGIKNSWDILTITRRDFISLDTTGVSGPRQADGSLPSLPFLRLAKRSRLKDAGTKTVQPYINKAPDIGALR